MTDDVAEAVAARGLPPGTTLAQLIEHERVQARLAGTFDALTAIRAGATAAERAFDLLLRIIAFGMDRSWRDEVREEAKGYMAEFRAAAGTCPNCGHEPHDPADGSVFRACREQEQPTGRRCSCSAIRHDDSTISRRY